MTPQIELQLGKNGLTPEFIVNIEAKLGKLRNAVIKIKVLRSARESKADVKKYADELKEKLGPNYTTRTMGFTICLRRWRKPRE